MAYVIVKTSEHGTSNPIVARLSVQSQQLMEPFSLPEEKKGKLWAILHDKVQLQLLSCYGIWTQVASREAEIVAKVEKTGIQITRQTVYIWLKKGKWSYSRDLIKLRSELRIGYLFTKPEWVDEFLRKVSK